ncbi:MAG: hypothetical protein JXA52_04100 [Planctomycetes bacterium]|nr:hypothetical protein [Planctomycetota bacterium]
MFTRSAGSLGTFMIIVGMIIAVITLFIGSSSGSPINIRAMSAVNLYTVLIISGSVLLASAAFAEAIVNRREEKIAEENKQHYL